jgi:hypothetical protein
LNTSVSNAGGGALLESLALELGGEVSADAQLVTLREINERDDPYWAILGESLPYLRLGGQVWKNFTTRVGLYGIHLGINERLLTQNDPTRFNRNYGRVYALLQADDIVTKGPFASVVFEYHYTHLNAGLPENAQFAVGGSVGYDKKPVKITAGSYYYLYKYDYYATVTEEADVRTYFGEFRYTPLKWLSVGLRYEFEQFDRDIHTVMLRLSQTY